MPALAAAAHHVVALDQRGYGRTTGWDGAYETSVDSFRLTNLARDVLGLASALDYLSVAVVVGHDSTLPPPPKRMQPCSGHFLAEGGRYWHRACGGCLACADHHG